MFDGLKGKADAALALSTLHRSNTLNVWPGNMLEELQHALGETEQDARVISILLIGESRSFCADVDMQ